ncbi:hypothetical protein AOLI_G00207470 [Acnodon oligacanthus]
MISRSLLQSSIVRPRPKNSLYPLHTERPAVVYAPPTQKEERDWYCVGKGHEKECQLIWEGCKKPKSKSRDPSGHFRQRGLEREYT